MNKENGIVRVVPMNKLSWEYLISEGDRLMGVANYAWMDGEGWIEINRNNFRINSCAQNSDLMILHGPKNELALAKKQGGFFCEEFEVEYQDRKIIMRSKSSLEREFVLIENGNQVGSITPENNTSNSTSANFDRLFPIALKAFLIGLALNAWAYSSCYENA